MADGELNIDDLRLFIMGRLQKLPRKDRNEFIKSCVSALLRRKQRFSVAVSNFEGIFKLELPTHIKKLLMNEKELFDANKSQTSEIIEQLSIYLLNNSPICDNDILNAEKMTTALEIIANKMFV